MRIKNRTHDPARFNILGSGLLLTILLISCVPVERASTVLGPQGATDLSVTGRAAAPTLFEGLGVTLSASATGGTPPYRFQWSQNAGPVDLVLTGAASETLTIEPIPVAGRYVLRVMAVDGNGFRKADFIVVEVLPVVSASAPKLAVVAEPVALSASVEAGVDGASLQWQIVRGTATLDDPASTTPRLTATVGETIEIELTVTLPSLGAEPVTTTRSFEIAAVDDRQPQVLVETNFGDFTIELDAARAPLHTANFLLYVDDGFYDGLLFHRNACSDNPDTGECDPFVLQGGGFARVDGELQLREPTRDPVPSEAGNGLSNGLVDSVALALGGSDANSGTTQFFINLADNSFLDDQGFTVFGRVVEGTDVIEAIAAGQTIESPILAGEVSLPAEDVIMERVRRVRR